MNSTGEQFIPEIGKSRLRDEHVARYEFASRHAQRSHVVLDIACGTGYGSFLLSAVAQEVTGVDISADCIAYADLHYQTSNLHFIRGSVDEPLFRPESFDMICSFETIEHLEEKIRAQYLSNLFLWLKPNGIVLFSTPNKKITSPFSQKPENRFHVLEYTKDMLFREVSPFFIIDGVYGQRLIRKMWTYFFVRKSVSIVQKIIRKNFHIYTLANGFEVSQYNPKYVEPRIFVLTCRKKENGANTSFV